LELAVDTAYFARAASVQDLLDGLENTETSWSPNERQLLCDNALDVVQTRSCRAVSATESFLVDEVEWGPPLRLLAPVFDFINHGGSQANSDFYLEGDSLVVRATKDLHTDTEVLIDYGSSARPTWKCLSSYGFVPAFCAEEHDENGEQHVAEVYIDGQRYEVGPTTIPEDMVAAIVSQEEGFEEGDNAEFTPEIAIRLGRRISDVAFNMLLDPWENSKISDGGKTLVEEENDVDDEEWDTQTAEEILSSKLAAALRFDQHRILLACSMGLRDWAVLQYQTDRLTYR